MKRVNLQATILSMLAIPIISSVSIKFAYVYILIFLLSVGWEKKSQPRGQTK